jgi:hypothetical protein
VGARLKISARYSTKATRSYTGTVVARSDQSAAMANTARTTNSRSQMMTAPGAPGTAAVGWAKLWAIACRAGDSGRPAFFPPSLRMGKTPVAALSTTSQATKTAPGMTQARSSAEGRARRRAISTSRTIPSAAGATRTVSRVRHP